MLISIQWLFEKSCFSPFQFLEGSLYSHLAIVFYCIAEKSLDSDSQIGGFMDVFCFLWKGFISMGGCCYLVSIWSWRIFIILLTYRSRHQNWIRITPLSGILMKKMKNVWSVSISSSSGGLCLCPSSGATFPALPPRPHCAQAPVTIYGHSLPIRGRHSSCKIQHHRC